MGASLENNGNEKTQITLIGHYVVPIQWTLQVGINPRGYTNLVISFWVSATPHDNS